MCLDCVVLLFFINYLPKTYIRPVLTSLLTAFCIILSTWLIIIIIIIITSNDDPKPSTVISDQSPSG